jgi:hypothetical protein
MTNKKIAVYSIIILIFLIFSAGCVNPNTNQTQPSQCTMTNQTNGVLLKCTGDNIHVHAGDKDFPYTYPVLIWYYLLTTNQISVYNTYTGSSIPMYMYDGVNLNQPPEYYSNPETNYGWDASTNFYEQAVETSSGWDSYQSWDNGGYNGYDSGGFDVGGYDSGGWDSGGYDSGGWDSGGYDSGGYDSGGYDVGGWD